MLPLKPVITPTEGGVMELASVTNFSIWKKVFIYLDFDMSRQSKLITKFNNITYDFLFKINERVLLDFLAQWNLRFLSVLNLTHGHLRYVALGFKARQTYVYASTHTHASKQLSSETLDFEYET